MNIQDALKETGKAHRGSGDKVYVYEDRGILKHNETKEPVVLNFIICDDWLPYHEEKQIRPENEGELWRHHVSGLYCCTENGDGIHKNQLIIVGYSGPKPISQGYENMIHGQCWTRLYPPVEDESVEKIEVEDVEFIPQRLMNGDSCYVAISEGTYAINSEMKLIDKPSMKMTLEWEKGQK